MDANTLIDRLGGTSATAAIFDVLPSAVSNWRKTGIPKRVHSRALVEAKARGIRLTAAQLLAQVSQSGAEAA